MISDDLFKNSYMGLLNHSGTISSGWQIFGLITIALAKSIDKLKIYGII
jgi:hypothetical protein